SSSTPSSKTVKVVSGLRPMDRAYTAFASRAFPRFQRKMACLMETYIQFIRIGLAQSGSVPGTQDWSDSAAESAQPFLLRTGCFRGGSTQYPRTARGSSGWRLLPACKGCETDASSWSATKPSKAMVKCEPFTRTVRARFGLERTKAWSAAKAGVGVSSPRRTVWRVTTPG